MLREASIGRMAGCWTRRARVEGSEYYQRRCILENVVGGHRVPTTHVMPVCACLRTPESRLDGIFSQCNYVNLFK